jgi:hypothetical protein
MSSNRLFAILLNLILSWKTGGDKRIEKSTPSCLF